jgi:AcrR family transcriptional regulator
MATTTHQRLIETGKSLFYAHGFRNVGLDQILDEVGISKTAFYKHFECKEDLMLAVLQAQSAWLQNSFKELIRERAGRRAADQLYGLFDVVEQIINCDEFHGCIFVNVSMEFPLPHDPAHREAAKNREAIENIVFEVAERAGAVDPEGLARELCLLMDGAYVVKQVTGQCHGVETARRIAERCITAHLCPEPALSTVKAQ